MSSVAEKATRWARAPRSVSAEDSRNKAGLDNKAERKQDVTSKPELEQMGSFQGLMKRRAIFQTVRRRVFPHRP